MFVKTFVKCVAALVFILALPVLAETVEPLEAPHEANNIILIGPPASGKGTQAGAISERYQIPTISTGDLLRAQAQLDTPQALKIKEIMASGQLVSDEIVLDLLNQRLKQDDAQQGFILDGFPRTVEQAKSLETMGIDIHHVIVLEVPDEEIVERISGRWIHPSSGRTYHVVTKPPKVEGKDDVTQEPLVQRDDDTPQAIKKRLASFRAQTVPVIDHYKAKASMEDGHLHVFIIDSTQPIEKVKETIEAALNQ